MRPKVGKNEIEMNLSLKKVDSKWVNFAQNEP